MKKPFQIPAVLHREFGWGWLLAMRADGKLVKVFFSDRGLLTLQTEALRPTAFTPLYGPPPPQPKLPRLKIAKAKICGNCGGRLIAGQGRCPCRSVKARRKPSPQGSLDAAAAYHAIKAIRSGSWAQTGYRPPRNPERDQLKRLYSKMEGSFSIRQGRMAPPLVDLLWFLWRCEIWVTYYRDERARLMQERLILWLGGLDVRKVSDRLQVSLEKLQWLDGQIRKYVRLPRRSVQHPDYLTLRRKMRAGVAQDIIRRWQKGFKQAQPMPIQQVSPFSAD